ncbi:MAG: hypothetical protein JXR49_08055 [Acidobacteria bacterium]|nr:hypothetical protein [Acidobacteriota bacterium]
MKRNGKLRLNLKDVYGNFLKERVEIILRNQYLSHKIKVAGDASATLRIKDLYGNPQGLYRIMVDPPSYLPVNRFVNVNAGKDTRLDIIFPVDSRKVRSVEFPRYRTFLKGFQTLLEKSGSVLSYPRKKGMELYEALDDVRRAGLLNIVAKTRATILSNDKAVFDYIEEIIELRGDRFFAYVKKELREEVKNSVAEDLFHEVDGSLHHLPGSFEGFESAGSFKTGDDYGNLQLTFFMKGDKCVADIDIDDASGLGHVFQVVRNAFSGLPTHPYNIHDILMVHQHLNPGYIIQV